MPSLPIIDLTEAPAEVARQIQQAGQAYGFFYLVGHGVDEALARRLEALSHQFFALPEAIKVRFAMARGGRAWRGWFPPRRRTHLGTTGLERGPLPRYGALRRRSPSAGWLADARAQPAARR